MTIRVFLLDDHEIVRTGLRALLESTAFGARTIIESFRDSGVEINELVVAGGLTKNTFLMQLFCDICRVPLSVGTIKQPGAHGSAVFAAVAVVSSGIIACNDDLMSPTTDSGVW